MQLFRELVAGRPGSIVGGHSYGGRVASMVAAEGGVAGVVLFSYPLHRPGHPEELRISHWGSIECPVLLLSGEADPFARIELLQASIGRIASAENMPTFTPKMFLSFQPPVGSHPSFTANSH